jgi:hypothetical protein
MSIEKIIAMPQMVKVEDGYAYDKKYVGSVFQYNNKLVYFSEKTFQEYPLELLKIIENNCVQREEFNDKLKEIIEMFNYKFVNNINDIIDSKLESVYKNFENVTKQLVNSAVSDGLKDSKRDQAGKLKMTSLVMLKELGYSSDEIKNLAISGLI